MVQDRYSLFLILGIGAILLGACAAPAPTITRAPTGPLPITVPSLPFDDNPDPTLCGIPEPDDRQGIVTGEYEGKLVQPIVYLYSGHLRNEITGQVYPNTLVQIQLRQINPTLNYYFVKTIGVEPTQSGWIPEPFLRITE